MTTPACEPDVVRLARNCWLPRAQAESLPGRCRAVLDSSADDSVICGVTAAALRNLWLPALPDTIHVATATPGRAGRSMTRTKRPQFVSHRFQLLPEDVETLDGIPVTSAQRTWRDLASLLELPDLVAAGDSVLRDGVAVEELQAVLARTRRARGARAASRALALLDPRSRSRPESHLRVAISVPDLPRFAVNEAVHRSEGGWLAEPDLSLAEAKLALEYNGADHGTVRRMRKDITRDVDMRRDGWLTYEYGPAQVFGRPWEIAGEVRVVLADRAPHLLRPAARRRSRRFAA